MAPVEVKYYVNDPWWPPVVPVYPVIAPKLRRQQPIYDIHPGGDLPPPPDLTKGGTCSQADLSLGMKYNDSSYFYFQDVVRDVENVKTDSRDRPNVKGGVEIKDSGALDMDKLYKL